MVVLIVTIDVENLLNPNTLSERTPMKFALSLSLAGLGLSAGFPIQAAVIAEWTFTDRSSEATAMASENNATGVTVSRLFINDSFRFAGLNNLPPTPHDGYGFGNSTNDIFIDRASYFDGSTVPSPRPIASDYTSFGTPPNQGTGDDMSSDDNAPFSFTVAAGALYNVTIESLTVDRNGGIGSNVLFFQEAGASNPDTVGTGVNTNGEVTVPLFDGPLLINAGETKSFTININSSALDTRLTLDDIILNGSVVAVPEPDAIALFGLAALTVALRRRR
ncbi:PEP-CTERM sorting domain-containing protein [Haloferula sp. A504]|uniref:PEP-CTERM sorting domain-containing protein n=1 Tax=Haloferula sp. A504 TaxID=3373601 RepID=UPI0031C8DAC6|nr:PEP-CTERM sorting domain-containing protein [Verrucomicrobiaceae bacterium E54]